MEFDLLDVAMFSVAAFWAGWRLAAGLRDAAEAHAGEQRVGR